MTILEVYSNPAGPPWYLVRTTSTPGQMEEVKEGVIPSVILSSFPKDYDSSPGASNVSVQKDHRLSTHSSHQQRPSSEGEVTKLMKSQTMVIFYNPQNVTCTKREALVIDPPLCIYRQTGA